MEAGLACVAIGFARGEWVLVEVGGSNFFFFFLFGFGLLMPGIDVWVMVAVGFDV